MELSLLSIKEYNDILSSDAPAPGGGAAAALAGAQGIALTLMVINLTLGREKYAEFEPLCLEIKGAAEQLMKDFLAGMEKDKDAFNALSNAYKLPRTNEEEMMLRSKAIGEATLEATEVPLEAMRMSILGLKLTQPLIGKSNRGAVTDLGVAAVNLLSCAKSARLNVLINLPVIKDQELKETYHSKCEAMYLEAEELEKEIYGEVVSLL